MSAKVDSEELELIVRYLDGLTRLSTNLRMVGIGDHTIFVGENSVEVSISSPDVNVFEAEIL